MIKKRRNIKKEKLKEKLLNEQQGFIVGNALMILPLIFSLIIAILVIVQAISSSIFNYIDNWILQEQTKNILENMATEITYADEIIDQIDFAHKETLIIATKRRATANSDDMEKYIGFRKEGAIIYRCEISKLNNDIYTIRAKQPLNSENYFGNDNISYSCRKIDDNLYQLDVTGKTYRTNQEFKLTTVVLQRNAKTMDNIEP